MPDSVLTPAPVSTSVLPRSSKAVRRSRGSGLSLLDDISISVEAVRRTTLAAAALDVEGDQLLCVPGPATLAGRVEGSLELALSRGGVREDGRHLLVAALELEARDEAEAWIAGVSALVRVLGGQEVEAILEHA